jgi:hypothetical protein
MARKNKDAMLALCKALELEQTGRVPLAKPTYASIIGTGRMPPTDLSSSPSSSTASLALSTDDEHRSRSASTQDSTTITQPTPAMAEQFKSPATSPEQTPSLPNLAETDTKNGVDASPLAAQSCATPSPLLQPSMLPTPSITPVDVSVTAAMGTYALDLAVPQPHDTPANEEDAAALLLYVKYTSSPPLPAEKCTERPRSISPMIMPSAAAPPTQIPTSPLSLPVTKQRSWSRQTPVKRLNGARGFRPIAPQPPNTHSLTNNTPSAAYPSPVARPATTGPALGAAIPSIPARVYASVTGDPTASVMQSPWPTPASSPEFSPVS